MKMMAMAPGAVLFGLAGAAIEQDGSGPFEAEFTTGLQRDLTHDAVDPAAGTGRSAFTLFREAGGYRRTGQRSFSQDRLDGFFNDSEIAIGAPELQLDLLDRS